MPINILMPALSPTMEQGNLVKWLKAEGDKVLRRKDVNNLNDKQWTNDWWGWSTYLLLQNYTPNTPA